MENKFRFYNTLTRQIETVIPHEDGKIAMYTCGPTVYHFAHIGNLRSYIMEDVLEKGLRYVGYDVKRVMNITDVGHLSSDADTGILFLNGNVSSFIKKLKTAKQIKVQASFFQEGDRTFTFTTPVGLEWEH